MKLIETALRGVVIIEPDVFVDLRGFFLETFNRERYERHDIPGAGRVFVQDNHSRSRKGVLRGLHFQVRHPQGKLFSVSSGCVFDVVADVCPGSPTFRKWIGVELSGENHRQLWVPPGYAHAFCVISESVDLHYKCTDYYHPEDEGGVFWNDPELAIDWPVDEPVISSKDMKLPFLKEVDRKRLPLEF